MKFNGGAGVVVIVVAVVVVVVARVCGGAAGNRGVQGFAQGGEEGVAAFVLAAFVGFEFVAGALARGEGQAPEAVGHVAAFAFGPEFVVRGEDFLAPVAVAGGVVRVVNGVNAGRAPAVGELLERPEEEGLGAQAVQFLGVVVDEVAHAGVADGLQAADVDAQRVVFVVADAEGDVGEGQAGGGVAEVEREFAFAAELFAAEEAEGEAAAGRGVDDVEQVVAVAAGAGEDFGGDEAGDDFVVVFEQGAALGGRPFVIDAGVEGFEGEAGLFAEDGGEVGLREAVEPGARFPGVQAGAQEKFDLFGERERVVRGAHGARRLQK